jgi:Arc/MetJ-type ribon-helix-helix transcriptional regulator
MMENNPKTWSVRKPRLNKKLVVRVPTKLFNELEEYVRRTQRFITISEFVRYLLVQSLNKDQSSSQMETGKMGVGKNGEVGSETKTKGREKENQ